MAEISKKQKPGRLGNLPRDTGKWFRGRCDTCGVPTKSRWRNLRAVANTVDESVATLETVPQPAPRKFKLPRKWPILRNVGIDTNRIRFNVRERAFAEIWLKECRPKRGTDHGHGILQDLFMIGNTMFSPLTQSRPRLVISKREAKIVATVIQWLGTNYGQCFLWEVNRRIEELKKTDPFYLQFHVPPSLEESRARFLKAKPVRYWTCKLCKKSIEMNGKPVYATIKAHKCEPFYSVNLGRWVDPGERKRK